MDYSKLVAVSGLPGLYELVSSKTDGAILRSLEDKSTQFAASRKHQFSQLESIEVYTTGENINLAEIFRVMGDSSEALPDAKDEKAVKAYFQKVYPDLDLERVYPSDMKKMVKWFDVLRKNDIEIKVSQVEEDELEAPEAPEVTEAVVEEETPPVKAKAPKKSADKTDSGSQAPAKKRAAKKENKD